MSQCGLTAKMIERLDENNICDARVQVLNIFEHGEAESFLPFTVIASSARCAPGFSLHGNDVESFVYDTILLQEELFFIELTSGRRILLKHVWDDSQKHNRIPMEEVFTLPESGHFIHIRDGELIINHKSASACFQSAPLEKNSAFKVVPDKRMLLWYLLGKVSTTEMQLLANIYKRNNHCW